MTSHLLPTYARVNLAFERGEGPWLFATDGERYLDFSAGVAVNALGHAHPHVIAALNAQVLDISVDSIPSHIAWRKDEIGPVEVAMCSDFYPHAEVTRKFGILREGPPVAGISERAAFVVNTAGKIAFAKVYPIDQGIDMNEIMQALRSCAG